MTLSFCKLIIQLVQRARCTTARHRLWPMVVVLLLGPTLASAKQLSTAIYYADEPPVNILAQFDRLVLESDNVTDQELRDLKKFGARVSDSSDL